MNSFFSWLDTNVFHPIFYSLLGFLHDFGLVIILITLLIRALLWPLNHISLDQMKKMQKLQPKIKELQEKYKSDPQRLQTEMVAFYKNNKINPFGGCLPMLIQLPILIAFYYFLLSPELKSIIEQTHSAVNFLWISDITEKDPFYILPALLMITTYIQQKITTNTADKMQRQMLLLMPLFLGFISIQFPAGILIYWNVSNIIGIIQSFIVMRKHA
ncbi:YidC/Oxa1 family membrane protein insertase [Thermodesulfobium acidiphilum]|uniref:YidC/Oxa1 family membrane protein insertase n=1 Tax=Thermodesulfobium acidiphilum TaxID=1794699 RepID=A0A2R4W330_THEAF|nr:YidC/Oxa1 family membrane protein insertase [Thermodesulfobium acidiphilum]AWB11140.1 YidC/Oxa1 family membrane protein insertase [Thermodesulfobium acidiphilum]